MSVDRIDPITGEVTSLTEAEARRLTERIRVALDRVAHSWADLAERITEAYQRRADLAMGYGSWAEYAEAELRPSEGLAADVRRQLVGMLSAQGMGSRSIAPVVGITDRGVRKSIASQVGTEFPPATRTDEMREVLAAAEREARIVKLTGPESVTTPGKITGLDGKTYTRPEPRTPQRRPITDRARDAAAELFAAADRISELPNDDRFTQNREQVAALTRNYLLRTIEACQSLLDQLEN